MKEEFKNILEIIERIEKSNEAFGKWLKESSEDFDKRSKKSSENFDKRLKESSENFNKLLKEEREERRQMSLEFDKQMKKLSSNIGGIGDSNGYFAEEFFSKNLEASMSLGRFKFHEIERNLNRHYPKKNLQGQYDIVLTNTEIVVVVEVKYKLSEKHVRRFYDKGLKNFTKLFPSFSNYKLYGAIASMSDPNEASKLAKEYGLFVLGQSGNEVEIINDDVKPYMDNINL